MKIQIVDDNKKYRETMRKFILPLTQDIIECNNGNDAIDAYARYLPNFVLMDIKMPVMDGLNATKNIIQQFPDARIILITDYDQPSFQQAAMDAGAIAFYSKENLIEIKEYLSKELIE